MARMGRGGKVRELFRRAGAGPGEPWWRPRLTPSGRSTSFGTWDGVFTSCLINIFGVVLFLCTGWLVGNAGVLLGWALVSSVGLAALVTVLSGVGLAERCRLGPGGVYSLLAAALGGPLGAAVGLLYVFGQCVAGAMYVSGFAESVSSVLGLGSPWAVRAVALATLLGLLGVSLAGVKWVVRLQLLLLFLLAASTLDVVLGSFSHLDAEHGFVGYSPELLSNNSLPDYSPGESFFTVFAVFFPAATGVLAGFNMSGDLDRPLTNIPLGSLAAIGVSWFLSVVFVFLLGAVCSREALRQDFMIAQKVSLVGFLFLLGLYISSLASCMGGLYGAPRILHCLAQEKVVPALTFLAQGSGSPRDPPLPAIGATGLVTLAFVCLGRVNVLAPIVTVTYMLTYAAVNLSFFSTGLAQPRGPPLRGGHRTSGAPRASMPLLPQSAPDRRPGYGTAGPHPGPLLALARGLDQLVGVGRGWQGARRTLRDSFQLDPRPPGPSGGQGRGLPQQEGTEGPWDPVLQRTDSPPTPGAQDPRTPPPSPFSHLCNPWVSLVGAFGFLVVVFLIQWVYTLVNLAIAGSLYLYIRRVNPGSHPGPTGNCRFFRRVKSVCVPAFRPGRGLPAPPPLPGGFLVPEGPPGRTKQRSGTGTMFSGLTGKEQMVLTPALPSVEVETAQLNQDNSDFAARDRYHGSSLVSRGELGTSPPTTARLTAPLPTPCPPEGRRETGDQIPEKGLSP
ncbi:solute carrier family 12 member 8 [Tachyglossus aculeatus]|uniref:solute carrier family 12 member 8 n=1 Tax=Tachyglossus aculeatus TaxID=9261 RepID=UPI0018F6518D|nr:solute carrier family 12 member 8 [Tachyglossus aculeatus]